MKSPKAKKHSRPYKVIKSLDRYYFLLEIDLKTG